MKVNLQFIVNCNQCPANDVFNTLMMFESDRYFETKVNDAKAFFEGTGWLQLPSGQWVCRKAHNSGSAVADIGRAA